jgi:hypothetical protein
VPDLCESLLRHPQVLLYQLGIGGRDYRDGSARRSDFGLARRDRERLKRLRHAIVVAAGCDTYFHQTIVRIQTATHLPRHRRATLHLICGAGIS